MPARHRTVFRLKPAALARACWRQDASLFRLQVLVADGRSNFRNFR